MQPELSYNMIDNVANIRQSHHNQQKSTPHSALTSAAVGRAGSWVSSAPVRRAPEPPLQRALAFEAEKTHILQWMKGVPQDVVPEKQQRGLM